ncbi:MAG: hypothetical protein HOY76_51490 [Streptomyces sp.]|nr:hypothetical protein [Streptomyces sp.]
MNTKLVNSAAGVINAALTQNRTAAGIALALDSVQLLMTPETADELDRLRRCAATQQSREEELLATLGQYDLRDKPELWALGMTVVSHLDGPHRPATPEELEPGLRGLIGQLRARNAELEAAAVEARAALAALCFDLDDPGTTALGALYLLQQATVGADVQPGETTPTVYRASHDSIAMGLYLTAAAAREHCETEEGHTWATSEDPSFDWIEDEEDGVAEMTVSVGGEEHLTNYVVTALEVSAAYDREADA